MDEREFEQKAAAAWKRVLDMFDDVEPDDAEVESAGDVIRIDLRGGGRIVMNTQRPARQIWLAGGNRAWHFSYDAASDRWLDDKGRGDELLALIAQLTQSVGITLPKPS